MAGGLTHYWTPQLRSSVFGSYARVEFGGHGTVVVPVGCQNAGAAAGLADFNEWRIGANTIWSPVSGLNLGVEVIYSEADYKGRVQRPVGSAIVPNATRIGGDIGAIEGRIRVQRDF